ncbi:MAG: Oligopeptide transport system permease protein OppB [Chlamydiae bacterium]|nr:Oligopeptide transport system permease protein OppB [Chlamydiota bacterium]
MKAIPGDPFRTSKNTPKEIIDAMKAHYGLNDPILVQYVRYLKKIVTFDLGPSFKYKARTVNDMIKAGFPKSLVLAMEALTLSLCFGILFGTISALKKNQWQDRFIMVLAALFISMPSFILASFLQYIFAMKLGWFPIARWGSFAHSVLPAISLAAMSTFFIARLVKSNISSLMKEDFITLAKAKGLSEWRILIYHLLPNAILPVIAYLGFDFGLILTGSFIIEKIFGIPGLGNALVMAITNRDYTVIMGMTVFYSVLFLLSIFISDLLTMLLDPKLKEENIGTRPI